MAGRGRGRGRGRGSQMSFDYSQLGFTGGEALPAPVLQPPPIFPPLEHKPVLLKSGPETEYMVALKRDFVEFLHSIRQNNDSSSMIERFSDKYQAVSSDIKESWESQICWEDLPAELNPKRKKSLKRKIEKDNSIVMAKKKILPNIDITNKLEELAKLEDKEEGESDEVKDSEEKEGDEENENQENLEEEDEDEEMDDGTDYVNNYFDNGESYFDDEDDNLDDGPIY